MKYLIFQLQLRMSIDLYRAKCYSEQWISKRLAKKAKPKGLKENLTVVK